MTHIRLEITSTWFHLGTEIEAHLQSWHQQHACPIVPTGAWQSERHVLDVTLNLAQLTSHLLRYLRRQRAPGLQVHAVLRTMKIRDPADGPIVKCPMLAVAGSEAGKPFDCLVAGDFGRLSDPGRIQIIDNLRKATALFAREDVSIGSVTEFTTLFWALYGSTRALKLIT